MVAACVSAVSVLCGVLHTVHSEPCAMGRAQACLVALCHHVTLRSYHA
jgi:hypothetical protein